MERERASPFSPISRREKTRAQGQIHPAAAVNDNRLTASITRAPDPHPPTPKQAWEQGPFLQCPSSARTP
jgi:hypothetical protein